MKAEKVITGIATATLAFSLTAINAFAAEPAVGSSLAAPDAICNYCNADCPFIDEDGDGICDYYAQGICAANGLGYVDADGNGVCDNYESGTCGGYGQGRRGGRGGYGRGNGCGRGYGRRH